jgi:hypothetical protein
LATRDVRRQSGCGCSERGNSPSLSLPLQLSPFQVIMAAAFAAYSAEEARANITSGELWDVTRVYPSVNPAAGAAGGGLVLHAKHGPSKIEVSGIPMTDACRDSMGVFIGILVGHIPEMDRVNLKAQYPTMLWLTALDMVELIRVFLFSADRDAEMLFYSKICSKIRWPACAEEVRTSIGRDHSHLRRLMNQVLSPVTAGKVMAPGYGSGRRWPRC